MIKKSKDEYKGGRASLFCSSTLSAQCCDLDGAVVRAVYIFVFPLAKWVRDRIPRNTDKTRRLAQSKKHTTGQVSRGSL